MAQTLRRTQQALAAWALACLILAPLASASSTPDRIETKTARFAQGRTTAAAVWTGSEILVFGGWIAVPTDQIVSYTPSANGIAVKRTPPG